MKKIISISIILFLSISLNAQQGNDSLSYKGSAKIEKNKDRLIFSFNNNIWNGLPTDVKQRTISQGYSAALMFDFLTSENSLFSFGLGLGYTRNHLYSNAVTKMNLPTDRNTIMTPIASGIDYSKNKLTFSYLNIPLELRFRSRNNIRVAVGLRSGLLIFASSTYNGKNPDTQLYGNNGQIKIVNNDISNKEKYLFDITARAGWKFVTLNGSYSLSKMFVADKGPQIYPYSLGVSLSLW